MNESVVKESSKKPSASEFTLGRELGQGNFSKVFLATHKTTQEVFAVKVIEKARIMRMKIRHPNIFNEVNMEKMVLNMLRHPNIVRLYHTFQDATNLYFLMEYVAGGELWDHLVLDGKQIGCTEALARFYSADIVNALEYMASRHIVHRDLKPENMIVAKCDGHLRIVDFGTAKNMSDISLNGPNFVGTPEYMSPETIENQSVDATSDLWALGCIIYQFFTGETPFQGGSPYLTFLRVKAGSFDLPDFVPNDARDLISQLLQKEPSARPTYAAIKAHPFFTGIDFSRHMETSPPMPTSDDIAIVQAAKAIAAFVKFPEDNAVPAALAHNGPADQRNRLMHVLNRMQLLQNHLVYPRFFQSQALGRCLYATKRGYIGYVHGTQNQWSKPFQFVHLSGPQLESTNAFDDSIKRQTRLGALQKALGLVNALEPAFLVVSGNMTRASPGEKEYDEQVATFQTALDATLNPQIRVVFVPGCQDDKQMTQADIDQYTSNFGDDYYSFWFGGVKCIVLNSALMLHKEVLHERTLAQDHWLQQELEHGSLCAHHTCVFTHHPFFLDAKDEDMATIPTDESNNAIHTSYNMPIGTRLPYVSMLAEAKVRGLFSSHFHTTKVSSVSRPTKDEETVEDPSTVCPVVVTNSFDNDEISLQLVHVEQSGLRIETRVVKD
ncbi:hypothetical protein Ae201684_008309 [Aphanomyces euteiches]|uniref:Protein kinase domain-containing protein n=1 Tax=Aphanomyces euteiches TaxID=100861 RepID=A0A6G0X561_9STRA|nr:hypothetical protein Ae201684_008309 [Aphanomyces euteiches]